MKRMFVACALLLCLWALPLPVWAADVYYNDKLLCQSEQLYDAIDGVCVPVRQLFEGLGYDVKWQAENNAVFLQHPQRGSIILRLGSREALILSNFSSEMPLAPYFHNNVLYAPLFLLKHEYCGYNVEWQPENERWQISDVKQQLVYPFADLTGERLSGVTMHFGKTDSSIPTHTAELNNEEIDEFVALLKPLAYREPAFTGEALEVSGGNPYMFDLHYSNGEKLGLGSAICFFYFFRNEEEAKGYVSANDSQLKAFKDFYHQLREKYLAK